MPARPTADAPDTIAARLCALLSAVATVTDRRARLARDLGLVLLLALMCTGASVARSHHHHQLSQIDELQHVDYLYRAAHGHLVHEGQQVQTFAMREEACRDGVEGNGLPKGVRCGGPYNPDKYQELGRNTEDIAPPTYYLLTGVTARVAVGLGIFSDFVDAGRALGGLWLAAGLWLLALTLRRLGVSPVLTGATTVGLAVAPLIIRSTSIVSNDVTTVFSGSLLLYVSVRYVQGRRELWPLALAAAAGAWLRATSVLGVLVAAGVVLLTTAEDDDAPHPSVSVMAIRGSLTWPRLRAPVTLIAASFVAQEVWLGIRGALAVTHPMVPNLIGERQHVTSISLGQVVDAVHAFVPLLAFDTSFSTGPQHLHQLFVTLLSWTLVLVAGGAAVTAHRRDLVPTLGGVAVTMLVIGAPFLVVTTFLSQSAYFAVPVRYGLAITPFVVAAGVAGANRLTQRFIVVLLLASSVLAWCLLLTGTTV